MVVICFTSETMGFFWNSSSKQTSPLAANLLITPTFFYVYSVYSTGKILVHIKTILKLHKKLLKLLPQFLELGICRAVSP